MRKRYSRDIGFKLLQKTGGKAHKLITLTPPWLRDGWNIGDATRVNVWHGKDREGWRAGKYKPIKFRKSRTDG